MSAAKCCPACHQTLPKKLNIPIKVRDSERRVIEIIHRAGSGGIPSDDLFDMLYGHDPDGGPTWGRNSMSSRINKLNKKLKPHNIELRATRGGSQPSDYVYREIKLIKMETASA